MDLRNELRGSRQNWNVWYKYVSEGVKTIHEINPDLLIIVSGLSFDNDLSYLKTRPLDLNIANKIVYESHVYSFSGDTGRWHVQPTNWVCNATIQLFIQQSGFLLSGKNPAPLFVSEFGYNMEGGNFADERYWPCIVSYFTSVDLEWSLWAFQGSYYFRQGNVGPGETYGVMDSDWKDYRDPNFTQKIQLLQRMIQGIYIYIQISVMFVCDYFLVCMSEVYVINLLCRSKFKGLKVSYTVPSINWLLCTCE